MAVDYSLKNNLLQRNISAEDLNASMEDLKRTLAGVPEGDPRFQGLATQLESLQSARDEVLGRNKEETENKGILDEYNKLFGQYAEGATSRLNQDAAGKRRQLVSEEFALGRGDSPVSRYSTARFDDAANRNLSDVISQLAGQQATGAVDYAKFSKSLDFDKQKLSEQIRQFNQDQELKSYLGRRQLDVTEKGQPAFWEKMLPTTSFGFNFGGKA